MRTEPESTQQKVTADDVMRAITGLRLAGPGGSKHAGSKGTIQVGRARAANKRARISRRVNRK